MLNSLERAMRPTAWLHPGESMTDDTHHPTDVEDRSDDHQQAVEACQHAADALDGSDLSRAHTCPMKHRRPSSAPTTARRRWCRMILKA